MAEHTLLPIHTFMLLDQCVNSQWCAFCSRGLWLAAAAASLLYVSDTW